MPIELTGAYPPEVRLQPGDVIMVDRELEDKKTKVPYTWRHFGVVTKMGPGISRVEYIVLDEKERQHPQRLWIGNRQVTQKLSPRHIWYLPDDEWPDGVHAFRTKLILEGRLDEVI